MSKPGLQSKQIFNDTWDDSISEITFQIWKFSVEINIYVFWDKISEDMTGVQDFHWSLTN